jgi:hypothetical protein
VSRTLVQSANNQAESRHSKVSEIAYKVRREAMRLSSINPIGVAHIGATDAYQPARRVVGEIARRVRRVVCFMVLTARRQLPTN